MLMYPQWRFTAGVEAGPFLPACRGPQWAPPGPHCFATGPSGLRARGMVPPPYMSPQSDEDSRHSSVSPCSLEGCGGPSGAARGAASGAARGAASGAALACRWRECSRAFLTLEGLSQHVSAQHATSGRAGLFYCEWQGCARSHRGFNARYKMLVHVRTHTNEKPHQCGQCDKSFSRAENLKIHIRSHSGEKPYVCTVEGCTKAYSNSSDRFKHTRTHSVDKPYGCKVPGCEKRYTDPSSLRKHVKTYKHFSAHITVSTHPMEPNHQPYTAYHRMEERVPPVYFEMAPKQPTVEYIPPIDTYLSCESEIIQRNYDIDRYRSISYSEGSIRSVPEFRVSPKVAVDYPVSNSCPQLLTAGYCQTEDGRLSAVSVRSERTHLPDDKCTNLECEVFPRELPAEETPLNLKRRSTSESAVELYENGVLNLEKKPRLSLDICDIPLDLSTKN